MLSPRVCVLATIAAAVAAAVRFGAANVGLRIEIYTLGLEKRAMFVLWGPPTFDNVLIVLELIWSSLRFGHLDRIYCCFPPVVVQCIRLAT